MTPKKYRPNQIKSIRLTAQFPQYCLDYLNKHNCGNNELLELLRIGIDTKLRQSQSHVDASSLFLDIEREKIEKINRNALLKKKFVELAEWFLFDEREIPFPNYTMIQQERKMGAERERAKWEENVEEVDTSEGSLLDRTMQLLYDDEDDDDEE